MLFTVSGSYAFRFTAALSCCMVTHTHPRSPEDLMHISPHFTLTKANLFSLPAQSLSLGPPQKMPKSIRCAGLTEKQIPAGSAKLHKCRMQSSFWDSMLAPALTRESLDCTLPVSWSEHRGKFFPSESEEEKELKGCFSARGGSPERSQMSKDNKALSSSPTGQHCFAR